MKKKKLTKEEIEKEIKKIEKIARMIDRKMPKGRSSVDIIREERE